MKNLARCLLLVILLTGCKKSNPATQPVADKNFTNVLILGNSITYAPSDASVDWTGNWGMAASAQKNDFVHLLTAKFQEKDKTAVVTAKNIAEFERSYNTYDFDANLKSYRDSKPDLIILRIGENVPQDFDPVAFEKRYADLVSYLKTGNPNVTIFAAGSFWAGKDNVDAIMKKYSPFVSLSVLGADLSNYAFGLYTNAGVEQHPCDKGMIAISNMIWQGVIQ